MKKDLSVPWSPKAAMKFISAVTVLMMVVGLVSSTVAFAAEESDSFGPIVRQAVKSDLSPPLRSIKPIPPEAADGGMLEIPSYQLPKAGGGGSSSPDLDVQSAIGEMKMPPTIVNFEGVNNVNNAHPPDTQGDVGPNHYVQMVNISFAIWDKSGTLLYGPANNNTLWSGFGGDCETHNNGDPIVLYDQFADRWIMTQFALDFWTDFHECIAISQTPDPTGAWYRYDFLYSNTKMNDYPKFGVWPDGYYMTVNQFTAGGWAGAGVVAYERDAMLVGDPTAQAIGFDLYSVNPNYGGMLPSDFDGTIMPPAGAPNPFIEWDDSTWIGPNDSVRIWEFHVDWAVPGNSTFGIGGNPNYVVNTSNVDPNMCGGSRACIPQPSPGYPLDAIADRLMFRAQYRNFGGYETLVANHTVDLGGDRAGIHWMELRDSGSGWTLHQDGVYGPADGENRWMGSIAMDRDGNIALGYSVSSTQTYPSIRYTGRMAGDPLGTLPQGEASVIAGSGVQTSTYSRWGDYSMMSVDPVDDCTFWYTQEYYEVTGYAPWQTRVGAFQFPTCAGDVPEIQVDPGSFDFEVPIGDTDAAVMTIHNLGGAALTFDILDTKTNLPVSTGQFDEPALVVDPSMQDLSSAESLGLSSPVSAAPYAAGDVIRSWASGLSMAWGVAYDSVDDSVWVSSPHANWGGDDHIYEYTTAGAQTGRAYLHTLPHENGPADVAFNWNTGKMWIMNVNTGVNNCIHEIDPVSGYTGASICPGGGTGFSTSQRGLAYDPVTDTYLAGGWNEGIVYRFTPAGVIVEQVFVGLEIAGLAYNPDTQHLFAIVNADPNPVYVLDAANNFNLLGQFNISSGFGAFSGAGLEIDCEGNLWAADQTTGTIVEVDSSEATSVCYEDAPWLTESPTSGTVPAGGSQPVDVMVDTAGLGLGTYTADIVIFNNDPDENPTIVPVTLEVVPLMPDIEVDPTSLSSSQPPDTVIVKLLDILNVGSGDLFWDVIEELPAVVIPASGDDFPRGTDAPSFGLPPIDAPSGSSASGEPLAELLAPGSSAYTTESVFGNFTQFDLDVPEVLNAIAPYISTYIWAGDFVGGDFTKTYGIGEDNRLVTFDTATGAETILGTLPPPPNYPNGIYTGMAYDPITSTMFASSCDLNTSHLFIVDLVTPTTIMVGEITNSPCTIAIGVNDAGQMYGHDIINDVLLSIDKATGTGAVIGPLGFDANYGQGMDFDSASGQLYLAAFNNVDFRAELRIADTGTGATALVGVLGQTVPADLVQLGWLANASGGGCIEGDIPWVSVSPTSGTTPPAGIDTLDVTFDSTGLGAGTYTGNLCVLSNDPDEALVVVPLELEVIVEPDIEVDPASLHSDQPVDSVMVKQLDVSNVGTAPLEWLIYEDLYQIVPVDVTGSTDLDGYSLSSEASFTAPTQETQRKALIGIDALVSDGSFENGPPPASAWTEVSDSPCEWIGDWSAIWGVAAFDGIYDFWGGGYCNNVPSSTTVSQSIPVPPADSDLSFWYITYRVDADDPDPDVAQVSVNGTPVWSLDLIVANNTYPDWVNVTLDLSAYAGQIVDLEFAGLSSGAQTGNIRFDYIEWAVPDVCTDPLDIPWITSINPPSGTTGPGGTTPVDVTFDSTGLAEGAYNGNLCVESNDPDEPLVVVPVSMDVAPPLGEADLWIEPPTDEIAVGSTTTVDIMVGDVTDLYGIELELTYNPAIVEVVGAQLTPGSCPIPDFVVLNDAIGGTIRYAVTSLFPSPPCAGGVVASITFEGLTEGISPVTFTYWLLADSDGLTIPVETVTNGEVVVISIGAIEGYVELQGRLDHSGAEVCGTAGGPPICTLTDVNGYYLLEVPQDTYDVTVEMERYLDGLKTGVFVSAGGVVTLPSVKLLGGDANEDDMINILDLSLIGGKFGLNDGDPGWDARADINNDLTVNILDIVLAASNFLKSSPVPWP
jgi:hypothetical protein